VTQERTLTGKHIFLWPKFGIFFTSQVRQSCRTLRNHEPSSNTTCKIQLWAQTYLLEVRQDMRSLLQHLQGDCSRKSYRPGVILINLKTTSCQGGGAGLGKSIDTCKMLFSANDVGHNWTRQLRESQPIRVDLRTG
jgi:hypothetical protein